MDDGTVAALTVLVLFAVTELIIKIWNSSSKEVKSEEEIVSVVNEVHEQGAIEDSEATMINNIIDFADKEAGEIMTNRSNIIALDKSTRLEDALEFMLENSNSRYPVFEENLDHVVGILYLKDAMRFHARDEKENRPICEIKGLIRKALFIPETLNINDLFKTMQSRKTQLAMVVDEYGQTSGLITMEDILEEIVGNIMDEYDVEEKHIRKTGKDSFAIDGFTSLSDVENALKVEFGETEFDTLNGFMISKLEHLPVKGEEFTVTVGDYDFSIAATDNRCIIKVIARRHIEEIIEKDQENQ
ncbi:MAG: hemolysin family protein [Lachnospiraceae bacterium]|nr:hemolysin family protein [Lachnospiraceae bacterium]